MDRHNWQRLNHLQIGRYAEYFVKMEFTLYGFEVYQAEVGDKEIDSVIRKEPQTYYDIQVKSVRGSNYIFFRKGCFALRDNLFCGNSHSPSRSTTKVISDSEHSLAKPECTLCQP